MTHLFYQKGVVRHEIKLALLDLRHSLHRSTMNPAVNLGHSKTLLPTIKQGLSNVNFLQILES